MQKEFPEAEVFEIKKTELNSPIIFAGFVGAGLVGPLAINHIITELKMTEIAFMRSKYLPPLLHRRQCWFCEVGGSTGRG